jgi:hypothetical protein
MARREYKPGRPLTLASAITSSDNTLTLSESLTSWPTGADGNFWVTVDPGTAQEERILCSTRSSTTVNLATRGADGTTASAHAQGATIWPSWSATDANEANAHIEATGYASYSKSVHGLGSGEGVVVGTAKSQTLTNKTVNLASNTLSGTTAEFNAALSDANFATVAGSETLTGKTVNLANNTLTGTTAEFNTALSDANFATLAGTETLTNKTITGGTVNATTLQQNSVGVATISGGSLITVSSSAPTGGSNGDIWLVY